MILNGAPNFRDRLLKELGKYVDLTVVSFNGKTINLQDPEIREGYKYIELKQKRFLNINWNLKEYTQLSGDYDVRILGYCLRNPFRLLNLIRKKRVILTGLIYGNSNTFFVKALRRLIINKAEGVLVYSDDVKEKLEKEISKPIISFNNTYFYKEEINVLPNHLNAGKLNILWIGRYQKRKKIERLVEIARKYKDINLRLVGPKMQENIKLDSDDEKNIQIFPAVYDDDELKSHFLWSNAVFNPSHAGLLVMNAARFGRPIFIDKYSHHAPEIQLAKEVDDLINKCKKHPEFLISKGEELAKIMSEKYTIEYMVKQYLKAIQKKW